MTIAQLSASKAGTTDHRRSEHRKQKVGSMVDAHVALRLKAARLAAGLSQESAAAHINLTFQQLQKYERATNRISAGKLAILAALYKKPVEWFFEGAPTYPTRRRCRRCATSSPRCSPPGTAAR